MKSVQHTSHIPLSGLKQEPKNANLLFWVRYFETLALSSPWENVSSFEMRSVIFDIFASIPSWNLFSVSNS